MDQGRERNAGEAGGLVSISKITRRAMVAGAAATTAMAFLPLSAFTQTVRPEPPRPDMMAFLRLSESLTGVAIETLAPEFLRHKEDALLDADPGVDPFDIKKDYFYQLSGSRSAAAFTDLLSFVKANPLASQDDIIARANASDDTKFLARTIVLLWYLGTWYEPDLVLKNAANHPESVTGPLTQKVLSPKSYTQGLVWLIAGAHPMGYSNLQFGYWSSDPLDANNLDKNGNQIPLFISAPLKR